MSIFYLIFFQLVSYFSWRVLSLSKTQTLSGTRSTFLNNVGDNNKQGEIEVADMLTNITNHLAGKEVGISTYELVNMVRESLFSSQGK